MSIFTLIGFFLGIAVFIGSVVFSFHNTSAILDPKSALMVIGGTVAITMVCFPMEQIKTLLGIFLKRVFGKNRPNYAEIIDEIVLLSDAKKKGKNEFQSVVDEIKHPFLKDAAEVLFWMKINVSEEELRKMLVTRAQTHFRAYMSEAKIFKTISKFPPALGLMGTTIGLIALLQSLGGGEDAKKMIGPSMAIALITTLYGLFLANFIFIPIAENLKKQTEEDRMVRFMIVEGVMLIQAGKPTQFVRESVKSYILPKDRKKAQS